MNTTRETQFTGVNVFLCLAPSTTHPWALELILSLGHIFLDLCLLTSLFHPCLLPFPLIPVISPSCPLNVVKSSPWLKGFPCILQSWSSLFFRCLSSFCLHFCQGIQTDQTSRQIHVVTVKVLHLGCKSEKHLWCVVEPVLGVLKRAPLLPWGRRIPADEGGGIGLLSCGEQFRAWAGLVLKHGWKQQFASSVLHVAVVAQAVVGLKGQRWHIGRIKDQ